MWGFFGDGLLFTWHNVIKVHVCFRMCILFNTKIFLHCYCLHTTSQFPLVNPFFLCYPHMMNSQLELKLYYLCLLLGLRQVKRAIYPLLVPTTFTPDTIQQLLILQTEEEQKAIQVEKWERLDKKRSQDREAMELKSQIRSA